MSKKLLSGLALVIALILSGCPEPEVIHRNVPISVPERPEPVMIQAENLQCLSDETFEKLVTRDVRKQNHIKRLEELIRLTHDNNNEDEE